MPESGRSVPAPPADPATGNGRLSRSRARGILRELALFLPNFLLLVKRLLADPRVPRRSKLVLAGTALYLVSPIDVVPDVVPGLGQLDDVVVVVLALHSLLNRVDEAVVVEHWDGDTGVIQAIRHGVAAIASLVPGDWDRRL